jgi:hypothetical protein
MFNISSTPNEIFQLLSLALILCCSVVTCVFLYKTWIIQEEILKTYERINKTHNSIKNRQEAALKGYDRMLGTSDTVVAVDEENGSTTDHNKTWPSPPYSGTCPQPLRR